MIYPIRAGGASAGVLTSRAGAKAGGSVTSAAASIPPPPPPPNAARRGNRRRGAEEARETLRERGGLGTLDALLLLLVVALGMGELAIYVREHSAAHPSLSPTSSLVLVLALVLVLVLAAAALCGGTPVLARLAGSCSCSASPAPTSQSQSQSQSPAGRLSALATWERLGAADRALLLGTALLGLLHVGLWVRSGASESSGGAGDDAPYPPGLLVLAQLWLYLATVAGWLSLAEGRQGGRFCFRFRFRFPGGGRGCIGTAPLAARALAAWQEAERPARPFDPGGRLPQPRLRLRLRLRLLRQPRRPRPRQPRRQPRRRRTRWGGRP